MSILSKLTLNLRFISFEPLLGRPYPIPDKWVDWIIVGAQNNPYIPAKSSGVNYLLRYSADNKIPIFMKNSMNKYWKELIQEFPKW
jgi:protein gp37